MEIDQNGKKNPIELVLIRNDKWIEMELLSKNEFLIKIELIRTK